MFNLSKPIYYFQKHECYKKHRRQLSTIINTNPIPSINDTQSSLKRFKYRSISFHNKERQQIINQNNSKLLAKILNINNRKRSQLTRAHPVSKINQYNNPARKKQQRFITEINHQLANRLIKVPSTINSKTMVKEMSQYEKLKNSLFKNRRILHTSLHLSSIRNFSSKKQEMNSHQSNVMSNTKHLQF